MSYEALKYTWKPFFHELAEKLLGYKNRQEELKTLVTNALGNEVTEFINKKRDNPPKNIDPFTVIGIILRYGLMQKRSEICSKFKDLFSMESNIPLDYTGVPIPDRRTAVFYWDNVPEKQRAEDIQNLWELLDAAINHRSNMGDIYDVVKEQKGIGFRATIALYWIAPDSFLSLDSSNRSYLEEHGIEIYKGMDYATYQDIMDEVKNKMFNHEIPGNNFMDLTAIAYDDNNNNLVAEPDGDVVLNKELPDGTQYFWLNANPKYWSVDSYKVGDRQTYTAYNDNNKKRRIFAYFEKAKVGDKVICYETTPTKKVKALCEVTKGLHKTKEGEVIEIVIKSKVKRQVPWSELSKNQIFTNSEAFKGGRGSLFHLTEKEYNWIVEQTEKIDQLPMFIESGESESESYSFDKDPDKPFIDKEAFMDIVEQLRRFKNIILQGAPGVGKTFLARKVAYQMMGQSDDSRIAMIQFHQSYSYEDFIQGIRPTKDGFKVKNGIFYDFCKKAMENPNEEYFFIIDEINRGNISKIFGELMMLIEADKRKSNYAIALTYSEDADDTFYVPENVYLIGCMNTADRSLAQLDYALRRRFSFITLVPEFNKAFKDFLASHGLHKEFINTICQRLNDANVKIQDEELLGPGKMIGQSYFCDVANVKDADKWWNDTLKYQILPYLRDVCFDDDSTYNELERILKGEND